MASSPRRDSSIARQLSIIRHTPKKGRPEFALIVELGVFQFFVQASHQISLEFTPAGILIHGDRGYSFYMRDLAKVASVCSPKHDLIDLPLRVSLANMIDVNTLLGGAADCERRS